MRALHLTLQTRGHSQGLDDEPVICLRTTHLPFSFTVAGIEPARPTAMLSEEKQGFTAHSASQQTHVKKLQKKVDGFSIVQPFLLLGQLFIAATGTSESF